MRNLIFPATLACDTSSILLALARAVPPIKRLRRQYDQKEMKSPGTLGRGHVRRGQGVCSQEGLSLHSHLHHGQCQSMCGHRPSHSGYNESSIVTDLSGAHGRNCCQIEPINYLSITGPLLPIQYLKPSQDHPHQQPFIGWLRF